MGFDEVDGLRVHVDRRVPMDLDEVEAFFFVFDVDDHEIHRVPSIGEYQMWLSTQVHLADTEDEALEIQVALTGQREAVMYAQGKRRHLAGICRSYRDIREPQLIYEMVVDLTFQLQRYEIFCTHAVAELNHDRRVSEAVLECRQ